MSAHPRGGHTPRQKHTSRQESETGQLMGNISSIHSTIKPYFFYFSFPSIFFFIFHSFFYFWCRLILPIHLIAHIYHVLIFAAHLITRVSFPLQSILSADHASSATREVWPHISFPGPGQLAVPTCVTMNFMRIVYDQSVAPPDVLKSHVQFFDQIPLALTSIEKIRRDCCTGVTHASYSRMEIDDY